MKKEADFYSAAEKKRYILPLLQKIIQKHPKDKTAIIGIQGGPGTGKTTLAKFLQKQLQQRGYRVETFSLDDFYDTYETRQKLARRYPQNPFYQISRGMPGTHRVDLLQQTLRNIKAGKPFVVPEFDKSSHQGAGDVVRERAVRGKIDLVLFEGWCLGLPMVSMEELEGICQKNKIPLQVIDPQLRFSKTVIRYTKPYQKLWKYLDYVIMLRPSDSSLHLKWRWQQERELRARKKRGMGRAEIEHFVGIYLPLTYVCYEKVKADLILSLDRSHHFSGANFK